jgi:hypothetical protein
MSRQLISLTIDGSIFSLRGYKAHALALGAGLRPTFNGVRGAWVADTKRLPDLLAYLERRNVGYEVTSESPRESDDSRGACAPGVTEVTAAPPGAVGTPAQLDLFGGAS